MGCNRRLFISKSQTDPLGNLLMLLNVSNMLPITTSKSCCSDTGLTNSIITSGNVLCLDNVCILLFFIVYKHMKTGLLCDSNLC